MEVVMSQTPQAKESTQSAKKNADVKRTPQSYGPAAEAAGPLLLQAALADPLSASPQAILQLQHRYGNRAVQRLIQRAQAEKIQREAAVGLEGGPVDGDLQNQINSARGGGQPLDRTVGSKIGGALGADFSGVKVHTDSKSDNLNRSLSAKAFTLGSDVFFSKGAYSPGTHSGKQLLAHELTHVAQQGAAAGTGQRKVNEVQTKLTVGPAGDKYEEEADAVAGQVMRAPEMTPPIAGPSGDHVQAPLTQPGSAEPNNIQTQLRHPKQTSNAAHPGKASRLSSHLVPQRQGTANLLQRGFLDKVKSFGSGVARFFRRGAKGLRTLLSAVGAIVGALIGVVPGIIYAAIAKKGEKLNSFQQGIQFGAEIGAIVFDVAGWFSGGNREAASKKAQETYGVTIEEPEGLTTPWKQSELDGILDALKLYEVMLTKDRYKTQAAIEMAKKGKVPMRVTKFKKIGSQLTGTGGSGFTNAFTNNEHAGSEITVCGRNILRTLGASVYDRGMQKGIAVHELCHALLEHEVETYHGDVDRYYEGQDNKTRNYWKIKEGQSYEKNTGSGGKEYPVTAYGASNPEDDMCETARYWFQDDELKARLKVRHPGRYAAFEKIVKRNLKIAEDAKGIEREEQAQPVQPHSAGPESAQENGGIKPPPQLAAMLGALKNKKAEQLESLEKMRLDLKAATIKLSAEGKGSNRSIKIMQEGTESAAEEVGRIQLAIDATEADRLTPELIEKIFVMDYAGYEWTSAGKMAEAGTTAAGEYKMGKNDVVGLGKSF
jgi:hypothetical protein